MSDIIHVQHGSLRTCQQLQSAAKILGCLLALSSGLWKSVVSHITLGVNINPVYLLVTHYAEANNTTGNAPGIICCLFPTYIHSSYKLHPESGYVFKHSLLPCRLFTKYCYNWADDREVLGERSPEPEPKAREMVLPSAPIPREPFLFGYGLAARCAGKASWQLRHCWNRQLWSISSKVHVARSLV